MIRTRISGTLIALAMIVGACGGSDAPAPASGLDVTEESTDLSEAEAVALAQAAAAERNLSIDDLEAKPSKIFGEWQVSFEPTNTDVLGGGFLVVLEAESGDLVDFVAYQ